MAVPVVEATAMVQSTIHPGVTVDAPPPSLAQPIVYQDMADLGLDPDSTVRAVAFTRWSAATLLPGCLAAYLPPTHVIIGCLSARLLLLAACLPAHLSF